MSEDRFESLNEKVDNLIDLCAEMKRENQLLKADANSLQIQRKQLLEKNKEAKDLESKENIEDANVVVDERSEEQEKAYDAVVNKINSFVSSDAIKEESGALQLDIKFLELGEETEVELKQMVNSRYSALKKQGL